ncbi:hypothetical protein ABU614_06980 [Lysobacter firmicutimachus]|uniref:Uncharacterized protein n=1 Tax=Lysobacter firmicutimachus TaxID=1792846 RepID=A0AAU8MZ69_9GAMM
MANQDLGAWNQDLATIANTPLSGRGSDSDATPLVRFQRAVMQLVVRREKQPTAEYDSHAAFVLLPRDWSGQLPSQAVRQPLLHVGQTKLTSFIHFVNVGANGHSLAYKGSDGDMMDALHASGVESLPTIVYSPQLGKSMLSFYRHGVVNAASVDVRNVNDIQPNVDTITEVINLIYKGELITPAQSQNFNVWEDAAKGWAHEDAEARVQKAVQLGLIGAFRLCSIRPEQTGKDGRTDLEIVEDFDGEANHVVHHAVLEMKVLRQKGSTGKNYTDASIAEHMDEGLKQAHSYGDGRNFRDRMLCCFDMREENSGASKVFAPLESSALKLGVVLRYWFLYRSPEHWRDCKVAKALA